MNPAITIWPANVPTLDDEVPDASSATANASAAPPPTICERPACAPSIVVTPEPWNSFAAAASIARLISPASPSAMITSMRTNRSTLRPLRVVAGLHALLGERRVQIDHMRHHGRADDPDREINGVAAAETRKQPTE